MAAAFSDGVPDGFVASLLMHALQKDDPDYESPDLERPDISESFDLLQVATRRILGPVTAPARQKPGQKRGDETRERVIAAAIDRFGSDGFARTSTRAVVEQAGANLVSIHYHFGGKDQLYCSAAAHIAEGARGQGAEAIARGRALAADRHASTDDLINGVFDVYSAFLQLIMAGGLPDAWMRFVVREQMEPTDTGAFACLFSVVRPFFETGFALVARLQRRRVTDARVRLTTMMIFGHVYVCRTNPRGAQNLLGWKTFGPRELKTIRAVARDHIRRVLQPEPAPAAARRRTAAARTR